MNDFIPTRTEALERLAAFLPKAAKTYASGRNYDNGSNGHSTAVSVLSPYIRHRVITELEVIEAVLGRHSLGSADKFIQEVFWRTYWKGWLQMRPEIWDWYQSDLKARLHDVATQGGLRRTWEAACKGETGIDVFDHWAQELASTGYLHNHARMWFASIWVFTLRLPWELGADFFLRHLLDGDPASNTLSWRWVAGLQTKGKTYLARPENISKYTHNRFNPKGLASVAVPLNGLEHPPRRAAPVPTAWNPGLPSVLLLTGDDLSPSFIFQQGFTPVATVTWHDPDRLSPLAPSPHLSAFKQGVIDDATTRWSARIGPVQPCGDANEIMQKIRELDVTQVVTPFAPTGPTGAMLDELETRLDAEGITLVRALRNYDALCWPHASHGFFRFRKEIPQLVKELAVANAA